MGLTRCYKTSFFTFIIINDGNKNIRTGWEEKYAIFD